MSSYVPAALLREIRLENYQAPSVSQVSQYRNLLSFIFEFKRLNSQSIFASLSWFEVIKPNLKLIEQMSLSWYHHSPISNLWVPVITDTKFYGWLAPKLVSWGSEATPSATPFFKRTYKISHPPRLWVSWIDLPSFASSSKIWPNFSNKVFFSWSYEKVILTKNVRLTYYSSMKKKFRKIRMIFDIENSLWKSNFRTLRRAGKARQSIPGRL